MIKLLLTACINEPKDKVWRVLSEIEHVDLWVEPIISASCKSELSKGIGTIRVCNLKGNITIREEWIEWQEGRSFTYLGYNIPMIKSAKNTWSVKSVNGKTLVTTYSEVELKGGVSGKLLEPLMKIISKRMGADSLAALKYLLETGRSYEGNFSSLPRVPIMC